MPGIIDFLMLFFPSNCLVCKKSLGDPGAVLCFDCELKMPRENMGDAADNPVCQIFWGRIPVKAAISLFRFEKGSAYQSLMHDLKYRGNRKAGIYLGRLLGHALSQGVFNECELLLPVPLHPRRLKQRGYNQSELIAQGVSDIMGIPINASLIRRKQYQRSQTSLGRLERFENMDKTFSLRGSQPNLHNKKILIIDDIVTTGATLEACSKLLLEHFDCVVYLATLSRA
jgi:ComF family protein